MNKQGKVKNILFEIKRLEAVKEEIQKECKHESTYLKFTEGTSTIRECCKECEKDLGCPSVKKVETFLFGK